MPAGLLQFLQRWLVTTLAVLVAVKFVDEIKYSSITSLLVASALLGLLNAFVRPLLLLLSLPLVVFSAGLFVLVINALLLLLVGQVVKGFEVAGFWPAVWGALVISIISILVNVFLGRGPKVKVTRGRRRGGRDDDASGGGVIDV